MAGRRTGITFRQNTSASKEQLRGELDWGERPLAMMCRILALTYSLGAYQIARGGARLRRTGESGHDARAYAADGQHTQCTFTIFLQPGAPRFWGPCAVAHFGLPRRRACRKVTRLIKKNLSLLLVLLPLVGVGEDMHPSATARRGG